MNNQELTQIFKDTHRGYFSKNNKKITAEFYPYRSLRHTVEWNHKSLKIRVSEFFTHAPLRIIKILAIILLAKVYKYKVDKEIKRVYQNYLKELQKSMPNPVRRAPLKYTAKGDIYNLKEIFNSLNTKYFSNQLNVQFIGWSKNKSYSRLGFYDKERNLLVISKIFDSPKVPQQVIEFLVYHEMLHIHIPINTKNGRRQIHPKEFKKIEQKFPAFEKIDQWIKKNRYKL